MTFLIHTVTDTATGAIRYVIAPAAVTLGLGITETVTAREPLSARFGGTAVTVVARVQPMERRLRIQVEGLRAAQGGQVAALNGDELVAAFFAPSESD
jgi:hypothetical protein